MNGQRLDTHVPKLQILKAGGLYFILVFGAGFALGTVRTLWIAPHYGTREAEMMEAPIMFVVTILAARWVTRRLTAPPSLPRRLAVGLVALGLLLLAEFTFVLWLRGLTIGEYLASRDPVAGTVYIVMLAVFAIVPLLVVRRSDS
jgi:MFS family permease